VVAMPLSLSLHHVRMKEIPFNALVLSTLVVRRDEAIHCEAIIQDLAYLSNIPILQVV
jgi:hypothetical protein